MFLRAGKDSTSYVKGRQIVKNRKASWTFEALAGPLLTFLDFLEATIPCCDLILQFWEDIIGHNLKVAAVCIMGYVTCMKGLVV